MKTFVAVARFASARRNLRIRTMARHLPSPSRRAACALTLLASGAIPAFAGAIHEAVQAGNLDLVKTLLKSNPSLISSKDKDGWTPLHAAVIGGDKVIVQFLLSVSKAEVNARDNEKQTPLEDMASRVDMVLSFGSSYGTTGTASQAPEKANDPKLAIAALLLANGANINGDPQFISTAPLLQACRAKNWSFASLLIQRGARLDIAFPDEPDKGMTPLHYAAGYGAESVVRLLLAHKAPVNAVAETYSTPLHVAVLMNQPAIAKLLRDQGAH